jgi:hypothetical protein
MIEKTGIGFMDSIGIYSVSYKHDDADIAL